MKLTAAQKDFLAEHATADLNRLLLSANKYPELSIPFLVDQLAARRQIREKLPSWYACPDLVFPSRIAAEQCSSEQTAVYKQRFVESGWRVCDLTGGLGVDSFYLSKNASQHTYIERFAEYCAAAQTNFEALGATHIRVVNGDSAAQPELLSETDLFYIDPARRGSQNKRLFAIQDCEPDLTTFLPVLFEKSPRVLAKLSPMIDLQQTLQQLPHVTEVHVLSVKNECKELLLLMERDRIVDDPEIVCINYTTAGEEQQFRFRWQQERNTPLHTADAVGAFLYEPNASVLKAGAFKQVAAQFGLQKLHQHSHLYTSDCELEHFPGRRFSVEEVISFAGKAAKSLGKQVPQANITVRNFPLSVEELRKKTRITDGGSCYLFATTMADNQKVLIRCRRLESAK